MSARIAAKRPLDEESVTKLRAMVDAAGEEATARACGLSTMALYRGLARLPLLPGTRAQFAAVLAAAAPPQAA